MPPKPLGDRTMSGAERQAKRRDQCNRYRTALEAIRLVKTAGEARQIADRALENNSLPAK